MSSFLGRWRKSAPLWGFSLVGLAGILFGLGVFTFGYARGTSYLSDNPETCVNCHIMRQQFDAWNQSSHKAVATCNDCHTPHEFPDKWLVKGLNGWNHSLAFTTGEYPDPIRIRDFNAEIAQQNCLYCHQALVSQVYGFHQDQSRRCVDCHGNVGHRTNSK